MADEKKKNKGGRPSKGHDPAVAKQVQAMAQYGLTQENIASIIGMEADTLRKWYDKEFHEGKQKANLKVAQRLFEKAMSGDTACLTFWAKTQMRWRETLHVDNTSSDGSMSPAKTGFTIEFVEPKKQ